MCTPPSVSMVVDRGRRTAQSPFATASAANAAVSATQDPVRIVKVQPRSADAWTADDAVGECYKCAIVFGALTRRHHCRACGSIFCYRCCSRSVVLPRDIFRYPVAPKQTDKVNQRNRAERVCDACYKHTSDGEAIWNLVRAFDALGLDMIALRRVALVCRDWCAASMWSLSTLREVQYSMSSRRLNGRERNMLLINSALLRGHGAWAVALARVGALDTDFQTSEPSTSCRFTMCTRYCRRGALRPHDALQLLRAPSLCGHAERYSALALHVMGTAPERTYLYLLPSLTYELRRCAAIRKLLVRRAKASCIVRAHTFWLLRMWRHSSNSDASIAALYERTMGSVSTAALRAGERIVERMMHGDRAAVAHESRVAVADGGSGFVLPVVAGQVCTQAADTSSCVTMESSTRPTRYTFRYASETTVDVLTKNSDVRADLVAMGVLHYMIDVLQAEEQLDLGVVTYHVMPVDAQGGLIEMVRGAHTLYDIRHRLDDGSVLKYLLRHADDDEPVRQVRARFVRSTAAFTVMTYLLGVGDRHLSNVMVTNDGRLFHVDYGYMLGTDPKPMMAPAMRLSSDMLEVIGGEHTTSYRHFQQLCTRIYTCLRRHVAPIGAMLSLLVDMGVVSRATLDEHLLRRFVPGADVVEAQLQLTRRIDECRTSTVGQSAIDLSHHHARTLAYVSSSVTRPVRGMFESFEAWWFKPAAPQS